MPHFIRPRLVLGLALALSVARSAAAQSPTQFQEAWQTASPIRVTGVLTILSVDDFDKNRAEVVHMIRDERTGKSYRLRFENEAPSSLRSGAKVRVTGRKVESQILVAAGQTDSGAPLAMTAGSLNEGVSALPNSDQRTLVMISNFSDADVTCSPDFINNVMFADPDGKSVNALYTASSLGHVSLSGDVVGPFRMPYSSTDPCDVAAWADAADAQAVASGVDLAAYRRKVYVMPSSSCVAAGIGTVGGAPSHAWIFSCATQGVYAHEIGHNLGMDHASTPSQEYGDNTDPMAIASWMLHGVNAPHRHQLGWLPSAAVQLVSQGGIYDIAPLSLASTSTLPEALTIRKADTGEYYYISFRVSGGVDSYIDGMYYNRLSIHRYKGDSSATRTFLLAGLADGETFDDQFNGVSVQLISHSATQARVQVQFSAGTCVSAAPSISFTPQSQAGAAGSTVTYAVSVRNQDGMACPQSTLTLAPTMPFGWSAVLSTTSLALAPGAIGQTVLTVRSASGASPASYGFAVNVSDALQPAHVASGSGTYVVQQASDSIPPSAPSGLTAVARTRQRQTQVTLAWTAATDNVGIANYRIWRNGAIAATLPGVSWVDSACTMGTTCTYSVRAYDAAGNVSAASNAVTVTLSAGKGK